MLHFKNFIYLIISQLSYLSYYLIHGFYISDYLNVCGSPSTSVNSFMTGTARNIHQNVKMIIDQIHAIYILQIALIKAFNENFPKPDFLYFLR